MIFTKTIHDIELNSTWFAYNKQISDHERRYVISSNSAGAECSVDFTLDEITGTIAQAYLVVRVSKMAPLPTIPMLEHYIKISKGETNQTYNFTHDSDNVVENGYLSLDFSTVLTGNGTYTLTLHQKEKPEEWIDNFVPARDINNKYYPVGNAMNQMVKNSAGSTSGMVNTMSLVDIKVVVATGADRVAVDEDGKIDTSIPDDPNYPITADAICLFDKEEKNFRGNGMAILHPNSCVVSETAGSDYSLTMEYPIADERWKLLQPGRLIRVPVPVVDTPQFTLADSSFWRVKKKCSVYEKPRISFTSYKTVESQNANLKTTKDNKTGDTNTLKTDSNTTQTVATWSGGSVDASAYDPTVQYSAGDYVTYKGNVYQAGSIGSYSTVKYPVPGGSSGVWTEVGKADVVYDKTEVPTKKEMELVSYTVPTQTLLDLEVGDVVMVIATVDTFWVQVRVIRSGKIIVGYVKAEWLEAHTGATDNSNVVGSRHITHQAFRITSVSVDTAGQIVTAEAMHKSYDMQKTMLSGCKLDSVSPSVAIAVIQASELAIRDTRLIATNITSDRYVHEDLEHDVLGDGLNNISGDWGWDNALAAIIDSDNGVVAQMKARLVRDYDDFFILENTVSDDPSFTFSAGTNLHGVTWSIDDSEVITRVIPTFQDQNDELRLLPEIYVDSDAINDFPTPRCEILDTGLKIGDSIIINGQSVTFGPNGHYGKRGQGDTIVTDDTMCDILRDKARARFYRDRADQVKHSVEINFTMLGDTDEYAPIKALGEARLYDTVRVKIPEAGIDVCTQVDGYEWDCTNPRKPFMKSLTLCDVYRKTEWPVSGIRIKPASIKYDKLSYSAKKEIDLSAFFLMAKGMNKALALAKAYTDSKINNN